MGARRAGRGRVPDEALAHYAAIADHCLARGLAPVVTFNHFTSPHWFAMRAGWLDPEAPALFARYCDRVMAAFGDRIAFAVTMNEPDLPRMLAWVGAAAGRAGRWSAPPSRPRARRPACPGTG